MRPNLRATAAAIVLALAATSSLAQPAPANVQAGAYKIEPTHTRVLFSVSHMGFTTWYGDFTGASGVLQLDPANPANSHLEVSLPTGG